MLQNEPTKEEVWKADKTLSLLWSDYIRACHSGTTPQHEIARLFNDYSLRYMNTKRRLMGMN